MRTEVQSKAELERLTVPGWMLVVLSAGWGSGLLLLTIARMLGVDLGGDYRGIELTFVAPLRPVYNVVVAVLVAAYYGFIAYCAHGMLKGRNLGRAKLGAALAVIPCCSPAVFLGIPFGIWALVVLGRPEVSASFE